MNLEASLVKVYCCKQCGKELTAENWSPSHQRKSYYICNQCHCIRSREWLQNHKDHHKEYRQQNKETINQTKREWCARNKDKIKEYGKRHYGKNKEIILARMRKWHHENRVHILEYDRNHMLHYHGYAIRVDKRPYPLTACCELCGESGRLLGYHHWDDNNPKLGLWLCPHCHILAGKTEKGITSDKYLKLKEEIGSQELRSPVELEWA